MDSEIQNVLVWEESKHAIQYIVLEFTKHRPLGLLISELHPILLS